MISFLRYLGRAKYKLIRVIAYVQLVNLGILVQLNGFQWWYLGVIPIFAAFYLFETKFGIPGEMDVAWKSSGEWRDYKAKDDAFKERVIKFMEER